MKGSVGKGNYEDFFVSVERDFYNSDLNKLVDRKR
jgi:hypothetical protein